MKAADFTNIVRGAMKQNTCCDIYIQGQLCHRIQGNLIKEVPLVETSLCLIIIEAEEYDGIRNLWIDADKVSSVSVLVINNVNKINDDRFID